MARVDQRQRMVARIEHAHQKRDEHVAERRAGEFAIQPGDRFDGRLRDGQTVRAPRHKAAPSDSAAETPLPETSAKRDRQPAVGHRDVAKIIAADILRRPIETVEAIARQIGRMLREKVQLHMLRHRQFALRGGRASWPFRAAGHVRRHDRPRPRRSPARPNPRR